MLKSLVFVVIHLLEYTTHQQSASMVAGSIQQEDKMCKVCESGGCSNCAPQNKELQFASAKEIEEFYDLHGESLWVDPAEVELDA